MPTCSGLTPDLKKRVAIFSTAAASVLKILSKVWLEKEFKLLQTEFTHYAKATPNKPFIFHSLVSYLAIIRKLNDKASQLVSRVRKAVKN